VPVATLKPGAVAVAVRGTPRACLGLEHTGPIPASIGGHRGDTLVTR
jgi:hypothetical protein